MTFIIAFLLSIPGVKYYVKVPNLSYSSKDFERSIVKLLLRS
jgi:hypothetical protein